MDNLELVLKHELTLELCLPDSPGKD